MFTKNMVNGDVRFGMPQEIAGPLKKLTEEAPCIHYFARLISDTGIRRVCEHPRLTSNGEVY